LSTIAATVGLDQTHKLPIYVQKGETESLRIVAIVGLDKISVRCVEELTSMMSSYILETSAR
jgi:hypothetical protein